MCNLTALAALLASLSSLIRSTREAHMILHTSIPACLLVRSFLPSLPSSLPPSLSLPPLPPSHMRCCVHASRMSAQVRSWGACRCLMGVSLRLDGCMCVLRLDGYICAFKVRRIHVCRHWYSSMR